MLKNLVFKKPILNGISRYYASSSANVLNILQKNEVDTKVEIQGWVKSLRTQKQNVFIDISDGSTDKKLQIFIPQSMKPKNLTTGSSIKASGLLKHAPNGQLEMNADDITVIGTCVISDGYPFAPRKKYTSEYIRQYLHFRTRTNKFASVLRVRSSANLAIHNFFNAEGYVNVQTPILTSNDCEGAGEVFKVVPESSETLKSMLKDGLSLEEGYFNRKAYLTVSGQLHLEAAAHGLSKVYTLGPTFRAENSRSRLHLSEFYMLEAEVAFVNKIEEILNLVEKLVKSVTLEVLDKNQEDVISCKETETEFTWLNKPFNVLNYSEAVDILLQNKDKYKEPFDEKDGFAKEHEIFLVNHLGGVPTFVINWPKDMKPFYMKECPDDPYKVSALDLLVPNVGELVGGSLRQDDYDKLSAEIPLGVNLEWYLDLRKFGGVSTGGFGLGFERYLQFLLGITNIKDTIPFPRWPHNCNL